MLNMILLRPSRVGVCWTLAYALAMLVVAGGSSKDAVSSDEIRDIEKFAGDVMGCANIPGLAVGIVRGDATFSTGLGVTNMATGFPADKRTLFNLGSTSKALVPYILAEIMNGKENLDGRISWTSTIKDILSPQLETEVPQPWAETSLKDMLVYKSGSSAADLTTMVGVADQVTREEVVRRLRFLSNTTEFHNSNHYSNIMYTVAGHLAERLSGMSWPELVKFKVLDKLKMNMTLLAPEGMSVEDAALPYRFHSSKPRDPFQEQVGSLFNLGPFSPAGSLMTSAEDVTKWLRHLVYNLHAEGNNSGVNMLIRDAFHKWVTVPGSHREGEISHDSEVALGYGMGWYSSTYRGQRRLKFSGGMYAYNSQIWLFPDTLSAIFVSINGPGNERASRALEGIMYHISDITLRKPAWVDDKTACCCHESDYDNDDHKDDVAPAEQKLVRYKAPVEKYIGTYGNGLVGDIRIEPNAAGVLILKLGRNLVGELTPGVTESKLRFTVTSSLVNTEEWSSEKTLEFLLSTATTAGVSSSELYDKVRIYITDHLFYEFHRGSLFESLLTTAEENDKRQREESDGFVHKGEVQHNQSTTTEAEYGNDDSDAVKDEADAQERNHSSFKPHKGGDTQKSSLHENGIKPSIPNADKETDRKTNSEGHQNHQPYSSEGHSSEGHSDDADLEEKNKKDSELDRKTDKNKSALGSDNACSTLQTFSIVTLLMTVLSVISN